MSSAERCQWCKGPLPETVLRRRGKFCKHRCRQAAWRVRSVAASEAVGGPPLRLGYFDPPYPGTARKYYGREPEFRGEVDHGALVAELATFDGWALSTSEKALRSVLPLCPPGARVAVWLKTNHPAPLTRGPHNLWEPVIYKPARRRRPGKRDWLVAAAARGRGELPGRKPLKFCLWLFDLLGAAPGDTLIDRFPGTGIVGSAFEVWSARHSAPALTSPRASTDGASLTPAADVSAGCRRDAASPMDERDAFEAWRVRHGVPSSFELLRRDNGCSCPVPWQGAEPCPWCQPPFSEFLGDVSPAPGGDAPFQVYARENEGIVWDPSPEYSGDDRAREPVRVDLLHTLRDGMRAAFGPPRSDNLICGHCGEKMLPGRTIAHSMICPGPGSSSEKAAEIAALSGRKLTVAVLSKWAASPGAARDGSSFDDDRPCPRCNQPIPPGGAIEHWRDCLSRPSPFRVIRGGKS